eukprot:12925737-Prorocentrum_lima.AAC.1
MVPSSTEHAAAPVRARRHGCLLSARHDRATREHSTHHNVPRLIARTHCEIYTVGKDGSLRTYRVPTWGVWW